MEKVKNWKKDLIKAKFVNLAQPGEDIFIGINTSKYQIPDNSEAVVPRAVLEVIKNTEHKAWKFDKNKQINVMYKKQRMLAIVLEDPWVDREKTLSEIIDDEKPVGKVEVDPKKKAKIESGKKLTDIINDEGE